MISGPILNTIIGAGIKLVANGFNAWIERSNRNQELLGAEQAKRLEDQTSLVRENAKDPFVQFSRRVLFMALTFTFCWIVIYFVRHPDVDWMVYAGEESGRRFSMFSYIFGSKGKTVHAGALLVTAFIDLMFMVIGFYSIKSNRK